MQQIHNKMATWDDWLTWDSQFAMFHESHWTPVQWTNRTESTFHVSFWSILGKRNTWFAFCLTSAFFWLLSTHSEAIAVKMHPHNKALWSRRTPKWMVWWMRACLRWAERESKQGVIGPATASSWLDQKAKTQAHALVDRPNSFLAWRWLGSAGWPNDWVIDYLIVLLVEYVTIPANLASLLNPKYNSDCVLKHNSWDRPSVMVVDSSNWKYWSSCAS